MKKEASFIVLVSRSDEVEKIRNKIIENARLSNSAFWCACTRFKLASCSFISFLTIRVGEFSLRWYYVAYPFFRRTSKSCLSLSLSLSLLSRIFVFFPPRGKKEEKVEGKRRKRGSRIKQISKRVLPSYFFCTRNNTYDRYNAQPTYEWICWHPDGLEIYSAYHHAHNFYDRIGPLDDGPKQ